MNVSLFEILGSAVLATSLVACGGGGNKISSDMAVSKGDAGMKGDMSGSGACTAYGAWATDQVGAQNQVAPQANIDFADFVFGYQAAGAGTIVDVLQYEYYKTTGSAAATAGPVTLGGSQTYGNCADCLAVYKGIDTAASTDTSTLFFATSGTLTVTKRDNTQPKGTVAASGSNLKFVEWDSAADAAKPNGACLTVASFNFTQEYDNTASDGGADM